MGQQVTVEEARRIVDDLRNRIPREECWTCDCLQGLLTQLDIDGNPDVAGVLRSLKGPAVGMHGCLGCDPCPPGAVFAA